MVRVLTSQRGGYADKVLYGFVMRILEESKYKFLNVDATCMQLPYLPVYNAHFFSPKIASKMRMRIIHGILLFGVVCLITIKTKKLNVLKHH